MLAPKGRVALPQILVAVEGKARELAPMESMAAVRPPRLMVVTVDMLLPPIVNNGVEGYCPTLGGGVERQVQLLSNSVKVKPALRRAIRPYRAL